MTAEDLIGVHVEEAAGPLPTGLGMARLVFVDGGSGPGQAFAVVASAGSALLGLPTVSDGRTGVVHAPGSALAALDPYLEAARFANRPLRLVVRRGGSTAMVELLPDAAGITALWSAPSERAESGAEGNAAGGDPVGWLALRAERDGSVLRDLVCELAMGADEHAGVLPPAGARLSEWVTPDALGALLEALDRRIGHRRSFRPPPGMFAAVCERSFDLWASPAGDGMMVRLRPRSRARAAADRAQTTSVRLSRREQDILTLLAEGSSTAEIAAALYLSTNTVRNHVRRLLSRLGVSSRLEAVVVGTRLGLLAPSVDGQAGDGPGPGASVRPSVR